ncbi:MAG: TonB-dependent receptor [Tannerella sp.]|jgi:TonB-linked SusC/RagA family outer membrane protein|nr:TonB-dependent receptor [Tannerella sp.]
METIKRFILLWTFFLPATLITAQTAVTGIVTDTSGEPLPGATVTVRGTQTGTVTNVDGKYSISVRDARQDALVFSFVGMTTETVAVNGRKTLDVVLKDADVALNETVVIGYGTAKKKDLTGSVASIQAAALEKIPVSTIGEALTGRLPGVQVVTTDGAPDAEIKINVRGANSITQSSEPLYIVDGFPVSSISDLAPSSIASVDVLKDASATAIYGSRGSNGVIIITTKSAKEGKVSLSVNAYTGFRNMVHDPEVLGPYEYARWQYEYAMYRDGSARNYETYFGAFSDMDIYKDAAGNDWKKIALGRTAQTQNYNATLSGSSGKLRYSANAAYEATEGILTGSDWRRTNLSLKMNHQASDKVSLDFQARYFDMKTDGAGTIEQSGGRNSDPRMKYIMQYSPIPLKTQDGSEMLIVMDDEEFYSNSGLFTPTQYIADNDRRQYRKGITLHGGLSWNILPGLKFRTSIGVSYDWREDQRFFGMTTYYSRMNAVVKDKPAIGIINMDNRSIINSNTLDYDFKRLLPKAHSLTLLVGEETLSKTSRTLTTSVDGLSEKFTADDAFKFASQGTPVGINNYYATPDRLLSFFSRANYSFRERYLLTATFRADGSSKFLQENRWGYFPSIAGGWRISEESFLNTPDWLYNLKLRMSYGLAGNNNIPTGQTVLQLSSENTTILPNATSYWTAGTDMINPRLKWETTTTRNAGLDYGFFRGRITGAVDFYLNTTDDLLIRFPIKGSGYLYQYRNLGSTENRGVELSVSAIAIEKKDFKLDFSFNISMNKNKVTSLGGLDNIQSYAGWASTEIDYDFVVREGEPLGQIWGYVADGRYAASEFVRNGNAWTLADPVNNVDNSTLAGNAWGPGAVKLKDLDGDHIITVDGDRQVIGNTMPKATGGFTVNAEYRGFDLNANFNYSYGNDVLNVNRAFYSTTGKFRYLNLLTDLDSSHRWKGFDDDGNLITDTQVLDEINQGTTMWSPLTGNARFVSSYIVEDGSFLRLSTLTVGYTLPQKLTRRYGVRSMRVYATGTNLFCLTNYTGFDPEVDSRHSNPLTPGVDFSSYPKTRGFIVGINLNF